MLAVVATAPEAAPHLELFDGLHPLAALLAGQLPGGEGADLGGHAAGPTVVGFVALHVGQAVTGFLAKQVFLLEAGRTPPGSIEDGALGAQVGAERLLLRGGRRQGLPKAGGGGGGSRIGSAAGTGRGREAQQHRAQGDQQAGSHGAGSCHGGGRSRRDRTAFARCFHPDVSKTTVLLCS